MQSTNRTIGFPGSVKAAGFYLNKLIVMLELDLTEVNFSEDPDKISLKELTSVLSNPRSRLKEIPDYPKESFYSTECGYSYKKRILLVASKLVGDRRKILQIKVAEEDEIDIYYCERT